MSFLYWEGQNWTQHFRCGLTKVEERGKINSLNMLNTLFLVLESCFEQGSSKENFILRNSEESEKKKKAKPPKPRLKGANQYSLVLKANSVYRC